MKYQLTIISDDANELMKLLSGNTNSGTVSIPASSISVPSLAAAAVPVIDDDTGPVNTNAPAVDNTGMPWDERIHAATKAQNADGSWRRKRGIDDNFFNAVVNELRTRNAAPVATQQPIPMPVAATAPVTAAPLAGIPMPAAAPVAALPTAPVIEGNPSTDFNAFMQAAVGGMRAGKMDAAYLQQLAQRLQLPTAITDLAARPDLIPTAYATLQAENKLA